MQISRGAGINEVPHHTYQRAFSYVDYVNVYVEHKKMELPIVYPNLLMKATIKRIEKLLYKKLVYIKVMQNLNTIGGVAVHMCMT
ncbi:hypothetical protein LXL04_036076 [Taraxacum kok-saghyz]